MCRNDKNIVKAVAIFVAALIVFGIVNYHHTVTHNNMVKHNIQRQVYINNE